MYFTRLSLCAKDCTFPSVLSREPSSMNKNSNSVPGNSFATAVMAL